MAKVGQAVQFVYAAREHNEHVVYAAVVTEVFDAFVNLSYFPPGGGVIGRNGVRSHSDAETTEDFYRPIPR